MQRGRSMQAPAKDPESLKAPEKITEKKTQSISDTFPRWAVDIPVTDGVPDAPREQINPRDFTFEKEFSERRNEEFSSVYPEKEPVRPEVPSISETPEIGPREETFPAGADAYDKLEDISSSVRNMTLEDMMLAGLLMMGSSGEYDDEIMLILGLILMIGA